MRCILFLKNLCVIRILKLISNYLDKRYKFHPNIFKYSEKNPLKRSGLSIQSGGSQKTQNICIYFKVHQDRITFLGEAHGLLNSHLEQELWSSMDLLLVHEVAK